MAIHIVPSDDGVAHIESCNCHCNPAYYQQSGGRGLYLHGDHNDTELAELDTTLTNLATKMRVAETEKA